MNYKKVLEKLGFIEGKDFSLAETSFVMLEQSRIVHSFIHHPAVEVTYDLEGNELTPYISAYDEPEFIIHPEVPAVLDQEGNEITPAIPEWSEPKMVEEFFTLPAPLESVMQETWKQIQISESDIALLIEKYLSDKSALRDFENDSINIVEGYIHTWNFKNIPQPTLDELIALIPVVQLEQEELKRKQDLIALGKKSREACDKALDLIAGYNLTNTLTDTQITEMTTTFSPIVMALSVHKRPNLAKSLISAITPDGTVITEQMKADLLEVLTIA